MVLVIVLLKGYTILLFTAALCTAQPNSSIVTSLNERLTKMDALLHEMQSHSRAQEEQSRALLTNLLSQLTQNTQELRGSNNVIKTLQHKVLDLEEELSVVKEINNKTLLDYTTAMEDLKDLKQSHNNTLWHYTTAMGKLTELQQKLSTSQLDYKIAMERLSELTKSHIKTQLDCREAIGELTELKQSQNNSQIEFEVVENYFKSFKQEIQNFTLLVSQAQIVGQMNSTARPLSDIGFEAYLDPATTISPAGRIVFDQVHHNNGNGYNKTTGYFTVPVSGTYLLWTNVVYNCPTSVAFHIQTDEKTLASAYGLACQYQQYQPTSATTLFYLKKGQRTWISPSKRVALQSHFQSAGAVLINVSE